MENFFSYHRYRWMWVNILVLLLLVVAYYFYLPVGGRSGSSWLGWTYGYLAAAGVFYLMWYGMRKRSYASSATTLKGCLSAHVWLGLTIAFVVPLHCAFSFGMNVHTLAYALMLVVVASGIYGALNYVLLAPKIEAHRGASNPKKVLEQIYQLTQELDRVVAGKSDHFLKLRLSSDFNLQPSVWACYRRRLVPEIATAVEARLLAALPELEQSDGLKLLTLIGRKRELARQLQEDVRTLSKMRLWLFVHLPLSLGLLLCLLIHIFVVYWYR